MELTVTAWYYIFDILLVMTIYFCARLNHAEIFPYMSRLLLPIGGAYVIIWGTTYFIIESKEYPRFCKRSG